MEYPSFPVKGDPKEAMVDAMMYLVRTYDIRRYRRSYYLEVRGQDDEWEVDDDQITEIRNHFAMISNSAFRRVQFYPKLYFPSPMISVSPFDNFEVGKWYREYMQIDYRWKCLIYDVGTRKNPGRDFDGFEATDLPLPPLDHCPSLREAITRQYRRWHHVPQADVRTITPAYYHAKSFVTGQSTAGIKMVLDMFDRPIGHPNIQPRDMAAIYVNTLNLFGFNGNAPTPVLVPSPIKADLLSKSAGINLYQVGKETIEDQVYKFVMRGDKETAQVAGNCEFVALIDRIRKEFAGDRTKSLHFVGQIIRKVITAIFPKPELGNPWRDPTKARLIFCNSYLTYLIDSLIYKPAVETTYGVLPIGIGWSKSKGGMQFLYNYLVQYRLRDIRNGEKWDWFALEADAAKLDFSIQAAPLTLMSMMPLFYYALESKDYEIMRFLMESSSDNLTSKFLHGFAHEDRLVIGMMFSGAFLTSWGDTVCCLFAYVAHYMDVCRRLREAGMTRELAHWRSIWPMALLLYGDDYLSYMPSYVYRYFIGKEWADRLPSDKPVALDAFVKNAFGINLKMSDSSVYFDEPGKLALFTIPDDFGGIARMGPKFLQRHFFAVKAEEVEIDMDSDKYPLAILSFRTIEDYFTRASMSVNSATFSGYLMKLRGLAIDTAGANVHAYEFLRFIHDCCVRDHPEALFNLDRDDFEDREYADFRRKLWFSGIDAEFCRNAFPSYEHLRDHYWPTKSAVHECVVNCQKTGFYRDLSY